MLYIAGTMWDPQHAEIAALEIRVARAAGFRSVRKYRQAVLRRDVLARAERMGLISNTKRPARSRPLVIQEEHGGEGEQAPRPQADLDRDRNLTPEDLDGKPERAD